MRKEYKYNRHISRRIRARKDIEKCKELGKKLKKVREIMVRFNRTLILRYK